MRYSQVSSSPTSYLENEMLAEQIMAYWHKRGYQVSVRVVQFKSGKWRMRGGVRSEFIQESDTETGEPKFLGWVLESDMVNGWPKELAEAAAKRAA